MMNVAARVVVGLKGMRILPGSLRSFMKKLSHEKVKDDGDDDDFNEKVGQMSFMALASLVKSFSSRIVFLLLLLLEESKREILPKAELGFEV